MKTKRLIVEPLGEKDFPEAVEVYLNSRYYLVDISGENSDDIGLNTLEQEIKETHEHGGKVCSIRLAETREMVGITSYVPTGYKSEAARAWIALLMISEKHKRKGYGKQAYELIEKSIVTNSGVRTIGLGVLVNNREGLIFWEKMGYRTTGDKKPYEHGREVILMEKTR